MLPWTWKCGRDWILLSTAHTQTRKSNCGCHSANGLKRGGAAVVLQLCVYFCTVVAEFRRIVGFHLRGIRGPAQKPIAPLLFLGSDVGYTW